jgi:hypothetical protein
MKLRRLLSAVMTMPRPMHSSGNVIKLLGAKLINSRIASIAMAVTLGMTSCRSLFSQIEMLAPLAGSGDSFISRENLLIKQPLSSKNVEDDESFFRYRNST